MAALSNLLSPLSVTFIVIILGYLIGKIKFVKISFDLSGVLIVAVLTGWILSAIALHSSVVNVIEYETNMKFFSSFGTALFVSSIGLSTGGILDFRNKKDMKAIAIGSLMVCSAFVAMKIISVVDTNVSESKLLGVLCGALTTTPGLSTACELGNVVSNEVILGYGCAYLFGVIATVLFVQAISNKTMDISNGKSKIEEPRENKCALHGLLQIGGVVVLGRTIGNIEIANFSLGNSGGMLCAGILVGMIVKRINPMKNLTTKMLALFRNMGLVLFFVGNGIPAGIQLTSGVEMKVIIYGVLMTIVPIISGMFLYKLFFKDRLPATTIAGGMTSTPAIGVLVEGSGNISLSKYALAYFGALITIIFLIRMNVIEVF